MRESFLVEDWLAYPSVDDLNQESATAHNPVIRGRIHSIDFVAKSFQINAGQHILDHSLGNECQFGPLRKARTFTTQEVLQILNVGDWVQVSGKEVLLVTPNLAPNKIQIRKKSQQKKWDQFVRQVREFFHQMDFVETPTPTLVECPGTEVFLDFFTTEFQMGAKRQSFYLPTSPELSLKKKLVAGESKIFEIKNCFRNGEQSPHHRPEFFMLEWYRSFANLMQIKQDLRQLMQKLSPVELVFSEITVAELFRLNLGLPLNPSTTREELISFAKELDVRISESDSWDDLFFRIFVERIEPVIDSSQPIFVTDYPPSQAAYARINSQGWGDRFEIYWKGLEIANAFHELNDPKIQRERFQKDLDMKKALGKVPPPLDEEFLLGLEQGMPPSAGIALGMERLFMALNDLQKIQDCY